jgi:hypothetical protein
MHCVAHKHDRSRFIEEVCLLFCSPTITFSTPGFKQKLEAA